MSAFEVKDLREAIRDGGMSITQQCRLLFEYEQLRETVRLHELLERERLAQRDELIARACR